MLDVDQRPNTLPAFAVPIILAMCALLAAAVAGAAPPPDEKNEQPTTPPAVAMNDAEQAFSELLTGAVLTGRFTVDGDNAPPKEERYEVVAATKAGEHDWVIVARIMYGKNDVRVPIPVKVHWAGDTPVLSLTDLTIPGLGTFTSRVLFYGDRYAGTWQHGEKGGHLFGSIGKAEGEDDKDAAPAAVDPQINGVYDEIKRYYVEFQAINESEPPSPAYVALHRKYENRKPDLLRVIGQPPHDSNEGKLRLMVINLGNVIEAYGRPDLDPAERELFKKRIAVEMKKIEVRFGRAGGGA